MTLTPNQRKFLLGVARRSIEAAVREQPSPDTHNRDPVLRKPTGAFVTLHIGKKLRGCVGFFEPVDELTASVAGAAVKAALEDLRFLPVGADELGDIRVEISVLSGKIPLTSPGEIIIGRDGLFLETDATRGVLLPQVAVEYGWDAETFIRHVVQKCGLDPVPVGTPGYSFYRFTAEVFSETDRPGRTMKTQRKP